MFVQVKCRGGNCSLPFGVFGSGRVALTDVANGFMSLDA